jgi:hypothetical protein
VPKGLYMTEGDLEREGCPLTEDSIYHSVSLGRGQVSLCSVIQNDQSDLTGDCYSVVSYKASHALRPFSDLLCIGRTDRQAGMNESIRCSLLASEHEERKQNVCGLLRTHQQAACGTFSEQQISLCILY